MNKKLASLIVGSLVFTLPSASGAQTGGPLSNDSSAAECIRAHIKQFDTEKNPKKTSDIQLGSRVVYIPESARSSEYNKKGIKDPVASQVETIQQKSQNNSELKTENKEIHLTPAQEAYQEGMRLDATFSYKDALALFTNSAKLGDSDAKIMLYKYYSKGTGAEKDLPLAFYWLKTAAKQGNPEAQFTLARNYQFGFGGEKSFKEASVWYKKAADLGLSKANRCLAALKSRMNATKGSPEYDYTKGMELALRGDYADAVPFFQRASYANHTSSMLELSRCFDFGYGVDRNKNEAVASLRQAAAKDDPDALITLGQWFATGHNLEQNDKESYLCYEKAASFGDAQGLYRQSLMLKSGTGCTASPLLAEKCLLLAAIQNYDLAQKAFENMKPKLWSDVNKPEFVKKYDLAGLSPYERALFLCGEELYIHNQYKDAMECFARTAAKNHSESQYYLGAGYANGYGLEKNIDLALTWYTVAAENGNVDALNDLGYFYTEGKGVPQDKERALYLYRLAADSDSSLAMFNLGISYVNGEGTEKNIDEAIFWFCKAAEMGQAAAADALNDIGAAYLNGTEVEKDLAKGFELVCKAADYGSLEGIYNVGNCYLYGLGVEKNEKEAIFWLERAANEGDPSAIKALEKLDKPKSEITIFNPLIQLVETITNIVK